MNNDGKGTICCGRVHQAGGIQAFDHNAQSFGFNLAPPIPDRQYLHEVPEHCGSERLERQCRSKGTQPQLCNGAHPLAELRIRVTPTYFCGPWPKPDP